MAGALLVVFSLLLIATAQAWGSEKTCGIKGSSSDLTSSSAPSAHFFGNVSGVLIYPPLPAAHRGIQLEIGSQKQRLSVNLATTLNATFVPGEVCNVTEETSKQCLFWRGGIFSTNSSTTWDKWIQGTSNYNGSCRNDGYDAVNKEGYTNLDEDPLGSFPKGWDTLRFGDDLVLDNYPVTVVNNANFPFSTAMLGLASDSRFLDMAVGAGKLPSHSWSLDYGPIDGPGEFIAGGYNKAKVDLSKARSYPIFPDKSVPCPLQIPVKDIKYGGTALNKGKKFVACLEPAMWTMILPLEVQSEFNKTVLEKYRDLKFWEATWEYFKFNSSNGKIPTDGEFSVELEDGFKVEIPNKEIWEPVKELVKDGGWKYMDKNYQATVGTAKYPPGQEPIVQLGAPFLSQVYLTVDYESNRFTLSPIKRGGDGDKNDNRDLQALGCDDMISKHEAAAAAESTKRQPPRGAIIGGAVGGFAVLAAAVFLGWMFARKKKQVTREVEDQFETQKPDVIEDMYKAPPYSSAATSPIGSPPPPFLVETDGKPVVAELQ